MTALSRLVGRALGRPVRLASPRIAAPALAAGLVIVGAAVVLLSPGSQQDGGQASAGGSQAGPEVGRDLESQQDGGQASAGGQATDLSGAQCPVPPGGTPLPLAPGSPRPQAECDAFAEEFAANERAAAASRAPTTTPQPDFWHLLYAFEATGPAYRSLADLGARSEAVVVGSFTGEVEPGREVRDLGAEADGMPREQASVFLANLPFRIDEVLAGSLPDQYRTTVKLEYMVHPSLQEALREVVPTDARVVMFIGSKYLRRAGIQDVYYAVGIGTGTFRDVGGRVVPLALPDDPQFGRLEGMPFEQFIDLVRRVPILDRMPEG